VVVLRLSIVPRERAIELLATEGDSLPDYSTQGDGQAGRWASRLVAAKPSFQACLRVRTYMSYVCVYTCVCMYMYKQVYMYIYACVHVYVHVYMYMYMFACICMCMHICACIVSFSSNVLGAVSSMRLRACVHMYEYAYVCKPVYMMMIAFITIKSSLIPLIEGLCAQI